MIPLDRWLSRHDARASSDLPPVAIGVEVPDLHLEAPHAVELPPAAEPDRMQGLEEALAAARAEIEREREAGASRERDLWDRFGRQAGEQLQQALGDGLRQLQAAIETSVVDVLTPLLERAAADKASAALSKVIREVVTDPDDALLSISAPQGLHDPIKHTLSDLGIIATLTEADEVVLVFAERRLRIETMVRHWAEAINGRRT